MKSNSNHLSAKIARIQSALTNNPDNYPGGSSMKSAASQNTKSWGPAMRR
jgi:hypothetical protein